MARIATAFAVICVAFSTLVFALGAGPMGVVMPMDTIAFALAFCAVAAAVGRMLLRTGPRRTSSRQNRATLMVGTVGLVLLAAIGWRGVLSFRQAELSFSNGDVRLSGTLFFPRRAGRHSAVVIVHGSGRQSRREYSYYAKLFARNSIAALAYDKRGVGKSTGELYATDYAGYAADAIAGVAAIRRHPAVDSSRVGIFGISEGEWVGPLAAAQSPNVSFLVVTAASGVSPAEQVNAEIATRLRASGFADSIVRHALDVNERVYAYQRTGAGGDSIRALLARSKAQPWFAVAAEIPDDIGSHSYYRWWRSVMDFDAAAAWERVRVPVLVVKGGRDPMSPADEAKESILSALNRGGNDRVSFLILPAADHALLEWPLGDHVPPPRFAKGYLDTLLAWVRQRASVGR